MNLSYILSIVGLVFGFGFVIFWHELGHFLAAKWVGIRVEQFAVGFGQAILSFRKGMGLQVGTSGRKYEELQKRAAEGDPAVDLNKYGETEYRLNWIPLGGYVKMLGQDDLNPNSLSEDPRSYNRKSIPARMLVVSAGVVMNIILAGLLFMVLFRTGFTSAAPVVGAVVPLSPADKAGVQVGDRMYSFDGHRTHDFTKLTLNTALAESGTAVPIVVDRLGADGKMQRLSLEVVPRRADMMSKQLVQVGIVPPFALDAGPAVKSEQTDAELTELAALTLPEMMAIKPGERIAAVNGVEIPKRDMKAIEVDVRPLIEFEKALQASGGQPLMLMVEDADGKPREERVEPRVMEAFGAKSFNLAGLTPRPRVASILPTSSAKGKLQPGDVVLSVRVGTSGDERKDPSREDLTTWLADAGSKGQAVALTVLRDGKETRVEGLTATMKLDNPQRNRGLGVVLEYDLNHAAVGGPTAGSPAADVELPRGATILSLNGQPTSSFHDLIRLFKAAPTGAVKVEYKTPAGEVKTKELAITADQRAGFAAMRYTVPLALAELRETRQTHSLLEAAGWGVTETRDFILQFYVTIRRMVGGDVDPSNLMGPVGIFRAGTHFAARGTDWLIWFLAMISANLAVVNFLPIPIVDGGLFTFLLLEKIKGRPVSARTQNVAQVVGLVLLLGVFLFVTYNDIMR